MHRFICQHAKALLILLFANISLIASGQVVITGPQCAGASAEIQYDIKGSWKEGNQISVCITGGVITENNSTCIQRSSISFIRVKWNESKSSGKITVSSPDANASYSVTITPQLRGGDISNNAKKQTIEFNKTPASINCSPASGGDCTPSYFYQWQESDNVLKWKNIKGQTGVNLSFSTPLTETTFFRRKATDQSSGTIAYSNEAVVYVDADMQAIK